MVIDLALLVANNSVVDSPAWMIAGEAWNRSCVDSLPEHAAKSASAAIARFAVRFMACLRTSR